MKTYRCGRCGGEVPDPPADHCAVCDGPMCDVCWEEVGYCGPSIHPGVIVTGDRGRSTEH